MQFLTQKPNNGFFLALDIGSEAVKAVLIKEEKGKRSIVSHFLRYFGDFGMFEGGNFGKDIAKKVISDIVAEIRIANKEKIAGVFLNFPGDMVSGKIFSVSFERKDEKGKINKEEEKEICRKIIEQAKLEISKEFAQEAGIMPKDIYFISQEVIEKKIDGYEVKEITDLKGKEIEFKIFAVFLPKYYYEIIGNIFDSLSLRILKISHLAQTLFSESKSGKIAQDGVFIDIGGEITHLILIKSGKIEKAEFFKCGGKVFSRTISEALGLSEEDARSLKERYSKGELSEDSRVRIKEIISKNIQSWFGLLRKKLSGAKMLLPANIYIFGGGSALLGIEEALTGDDWEKQQHSIGLEMQSSFISAPEVRMLFPKDLSTDINIPEKLNNPQFTPVFFLIKQ